MLAHLGSPGQRAVKRVCVGESKSAALVAAVFVDFPENKCNFLPKTAPYEGFPPEAVDTIAPWKLAPG